MLKSTLAHPALSGIEVGSAEWFRAQRAVILSKPLVRRCYDLWYQYLLADADSVPAPYQTGVIVELGSGSSYIKQVRSSVITSDVTAGIADMTIDGRKLPFPDNSVQALLLTHVLHHIPDVGKFFAEASRVLVPNGVISIVDIPHTPFARLFFSKFHPEPYEDTAAEWTFEDGNTMYDSNQALSWMVFYRDAQLFRERFPTLLLERMRYLPWCSYLLSGGVNLRSLVPAGLAGVGRYLDGLLQPLDRMFAIHWHLTVRRSGGAHGR